MSEDPTTIRELLIDGDIVCYRAGFVCKPGDPEYHALSNTNNTLNKILKKFPDAGSYTIYLQGPGNFRHDVAVTNPYKGNRDPNFKPEHYDAIRAYLENKWGAEIISGMETDDALGIKQCAADEGTTCIVTIDKDLDMIPGWHYNQLKEKLYYVSARDADTNYYRQLLVGDTTDNIKGIRGIGPVKAARLIPSDLDAGRAGEIVEQVYRQSLGSGGYEYLQEVKQLIWIKRELNDTPR